MVSETGQGVSRARSSLRCGGCQGFSLAKPHCDELREIKKSSRRPLLPSSLRLEGIYTGRYIYKGSCRSPFENGTGHYLIQPGFFSNEW